MPITGAVPKPRDQIRHRNPATFEWVDVPNVPFKGGPSLRGRRRPCGRPWPKQALARWEVWRSMPHCVLWEQTDWDFAVDTLELVAQFYESDTARTPLVAELRVREKVMGTTLDFRRALRIRYVDAGGRADEGTVSRIADYRAL